LAEHFPKYYGPGLGHIKRIKLPEHGDAHQGGAALAHARTQPFVLIAQDKDRGKVELDVPKIEGGVVVGSAIYRDFLICEAF